ncbi:hypothetical protein CFB40_08810 [Burkholderia sp. AU31652]|nr:hypothetical protein CFB40_08810 [Burkholderia sp. AU31652]
MSCSVDVDEFDQLESLEPYPDHAIHATHEGCTESSNSYPSFGRREEPAYASARRLATPCTMRLNR